MGKNNLRKQYFRKKIIEDLDRIKEYPVTVIEAPMGYGKSIAAKEWIKSSDYTCIWQSVFDYGVDYIWEELIENVSRVSGNHLKRLAGSSFPRTRASIRNVATIIREQNLTHGTVIFLDDYHLLESSYADELIKRVCELEIENLHIVLIVRFVNFSFTEELELKGLLYHIKKEAFEFNLHDILKYYKLCGINLSKPEAEELLAYTEGWVSALYLLLLDYNDMGKVSPSLGIYRLVDKAIYSPLGSEMKKFLLCISVADILTIEHARYLWESDSADRLLKELTEMNNFVVYNRETKYYSLHSILAGFIREQLKAESDDFRKTVYEKNAEWYVEIKDYYLARRYYYESGNYHGVLYTMEIDKSRNFTFENKELVKKYINWCPNEIKSRHCYAMFYYLVHLFAHKETELFAKTLNELMGYIMGNQEIDTVSRNHLLGDVEVIVSLSKLNDLELMLPHYEKAWKLLKGPTSIYISGSNWSFGSPSILGIYYREKGKLCYHVDMLDDFMPFYLQLTNGHGSGGNSIMKAELFYNKGLFDESEVLTHKGYLRAQRQSEDTLYCGLFLKFKIFLIKGKLVEANKVLKRISHDLDKRSVYSSLDITELIEGYVYSYLNEKSRIPNSLIDLDTGEDQVLFPALPFYNIIYGRCLLIKGEYLKLIGCSEYFLSVANVLPNLLGVIYTNIYLCAANRMGFKDEDACDYLEEAMDIAFADELLMPFVENYDYIGEVLEGYLDVRDYRDKIIKIKDLYGPYSKNRRDFVNKYFRKNVMVLTQREKEIGELAALGLINGEIGERLYISENTVKKALSSIYKKLDIHSRVELKEYLLIEK